MNNENSVIAYKCYNLLKECIDVDNIENKIFIKNNLNRIRSIVLSYLMICIAILHFL